jgi:hypothetical protein
MEGSNMNKELNKENENVLNELEGLIPISDEEIGEDIRVWLQTPPSPQIKDYGFEDVDREEEYFAMLNEISEYLVER